MDQSSVSEVEEQAENEAEELGPKRGAMLKFFSLKKMDLDQMSIFCKYCWAKFVSAGSNTSNLIHISRKHVFEYQECRFASSEGIVGSGTTKEKTSQMLLKDTFTRETDKRNNGGWTL